MALRLYNTLTRTTEEVLPIEGRTLRFYACGPTVYDFVHIGNFRTFTFQDLLRRYLLYKGFGLTHVMNITDVDDKIINGAGARGEPIQEYTSRYTHAFLEDMEALRLQRPEIMPRATRHITQMVDLILRLRRKGLTYEQEGSTYYRIDGLPAYGRLSRLDLGEAERGDATDADDYSKDNPRDFVLWKARKPGEAYWDTALGPGRPGWHIECSAMSMEYLGESFDLHAGGVDLVFPHHENEIAQSEGATGKPFVRHWVHSAHLVVEGEKMSKSRGNFYTLRDLLGQGWDPLAVRYLLLSVHYRKQLNFSFQGMTQAQSALQRVNDFIQRIREVPDEAEESRELTEAARQAERNFESSLDDDLNTSAALAAIFELVRKGNLLLEKKQVGGPDRDAVLSFFSKVNGVFETFQLETLELEDNEIARLIQERTRARQTRDYARADQIRSLLSEKGIVLEDTREGTRWKRAT
ncbi:MAG: cysteine--tRNA ligase [Candidatus Aminicenantes bacterium]|nr:cysteine--tRNA ligase [Candidatus Aminicenantes bacterium]